MQIIIAGTSTRTIEEAVNFIGFHFSSFSVLLGTKCFPGSDKSLSLHCEKTVLGDVLIAEEMATFKCNSKQKKVEKQWK